MTEVSHESTPAVKLTPSAKAILAYARSRKKFTSTQAMSALKISERTFHRATKVLREVQLIACEQIWTREGKASSWSAVTR